jgi:hypothetical protein
MWSPSPAMSHATLVETYIEALNLTAVAIVGAGRQCRITEGESARGEKIERQFYFKPSHAELVLVTIDVEGLSGKPLAAVAGAIEQAAAKARRAISDACRSPEGRGGAGRRDRRAGQDCGPIGQIEAVERSL